MGFGSAQCLAEWLLGVHALHEGTSVAGIFHEFLHELCCSVACVLVAVLFCDTTTFRFVASVVVVVHFVPFSMYSVCSLLCCLFLVFFFPLAPYSCIQVVYKAGV